MGSLPYVRAGSGLMRPGLHQEPQTVAMPLSVSSVVPG
jgi:hypothetical protein